MGDHQEESWHGRAEEDREHTYQAEVPAYHIDHSNHEEGHNDWEDNQEEVKVLLQERSSQDEDQGEGAERLSVYNHPRL